MIDSADVMAARRMVIDVIRSEHVALGEVLALLQRSLRNIELGTSAADFHLLSLALYYIEDFPCRCHHPKEERYLFPAVRRHTIQFAALLNQLDAEHASDAQRVRDLCRALVRYQAGAPRGLEQLRSAVDIYAAITYDHMRREESFLVEIGVALPDDEWHALAAALSEEQEPLLGGRPHGEFGKLRDRIDNLLPTKLRARSDTGPPPD